METRIRVCVCLLMVTLLMVFRQEIQDTAMDIAFYCARYTMGVSTFHCNVDQLKRSRVVMDTAVRRFDWSWMRGQPPYFELVLADKSDWVSFAIGRIYHLGDFRQRALAAYVLYCRSGEVCYLRDMYDLLYADQSRPAWIAFRRLSDGLLSHLSEGVEDLHLTRKRFDFPDHLVPSSGIQPEFFDELARNWSEHEVKSRIGD